MPSRNESARARTRLQLETPVFEDATLLELQEQAADYVREARRRNPSGPDELVTSVVDAIARDYFRHAIRQRHRRRLNRRVLPIVLMLFLMTFAAAPALA